MSLRTSINWLITLVMLLFIGTLAALQIVGARRATAAEMEAGTLITVQLLTSLVGDEAQPGPTSLAGLAAFLDQAGRIRAHDIQVLDEAGQVLHRSPPSPWKPGREAPAWFSRLVAPEARPLALPLQGGSVRIVPDPSRMVLDAWDELLTLFWLSLLLFTLLNLLVFWFAARTVRENHAWLQLIQRHIEDERRNLAHELHDEIGQSLTAIKTLAATLVNRTRDRQPELQALGQTIVDVAAQMYDAMYSLVRQLRPLVLDKLGLQAALQDLVDSQRARHPDIEFRLALTGDLARVGPDVAITAYRMVQESLTNVVRHAAATRAEVSVDAGERLTLVVQDDGQGSRTDPNDRSERYGLIGMRERAEGLGGSFHWQGDDGVRVQVTLPLRAEVPG